MKKIMFIFMFLVFCTYSTYSENQLETTCTATYIKDSLTINIKIKNIKSKNKDDESHDIYIPYSEWLLKGNKDGNNIPAVSYSMFGIAVSTITYIPSNYLQIISEGQDVSMKSNMEYLPRLIEVSNKNNAEFCLSYKDTNKDLFIDSLNYQVFIEIPYIESKFFEFIWDISEDSDMIIYNSMDDSDSPVFINLNQYLKRDLKRDLNQIYYKKYTNIPIDKCKEKLMQMALINKVIECNCKIERK